MYYNKIKKNTIRNSLNVNEMSKIYEYLLFAVRNLLNVNGL